MTHVHRDGYTETARLPKPDDGYMPNRALDEVRAVLAWGESHKHAGDSFRDERTRAHHVHKALGHAAIALQGERYDEETGRRVLAHAAARLLLALERELRGLT